MAQNTLRLEQYDTVHFDTNINPLGIPASVRRAIAENINAIVKYPDIYYSKLKKAISAYVQAPEDTIIIGNGSSDLIRLFAALIMPKKAKLLTPGFHEYEQVLSAYGCECDFYDLKEEEDFQLDVKDFIGTLDSSYDIIFIGNPNNPTSKKVALEDIETLTAACQALDIFLVVDESYIEFLDDFASYTAISLTAEYENLAVLRGVSKFFGVPGIRLAYAVMNNPAQMQIINLTTTTNNIPTLSAIAGTVMFQDEKYILDSSSMIHTERNLVYSAMYPCKTIRIVKPDANFMLVKLLKEGLTANDVYEHCRLKGVIIRRCDDMRGLGEKYIRFCFMNPKQNDLMVNTILEIV